MNLTCFGFDQRLQALFHPHASAGLEPGYTLADGIEVMQRLASEILDENFATDLAGQSRDFAESSSSLAFVFILALIMVYLVLSAQFESFRDPFIIRSA